MEEVKKPNVKIIYSGKNITEDLKPFLKSVSYTDNVAGKSDEISLELLDTDGLWRNQWFPSKADLIVLWMGYDGLLFPCGTFEVDELQLSGPPDGVTIRAIAAPISKNIRTLKSHAHESKTLRQMAQTIAESQGLTLQGEINNELIISRTSQYQETDLSFLNRISKDFGYVFSVRGVDLVFTSIYELESASSVLEIHRSKLTSYSITDKTSKVYTAVNVNYSNPENGKLVKGSATGVADGQTDTLEIWRKAENQQQADEMAKSILHNKNTQKQTARFTVPGNILLLSGVNVDITGMGRTSGQYQIIESNHAINPGSGYITTFNCKKIAEIPSNKWL